MLENSKNLFFQSLQKSKKAYLEKFINNLLKGLINMPEVIIRFPEVVKRTGYSRSGIALKVSRGTFPAPIPLGDRAIGWLESEIDNWIEERIKQRGEGAGTKTICSGVENNI